MTLSMSARTLWLLVTRHNFSLVARYSLEFTRYSLLVVKSLFTRCRSCSLQKITRYSLKLCSLLVAEVASCKNSLVTRFRSCSLQKVTRYSLQNSLVTRCRSCSSQKFTGYSLQNLLVTRGNKSLVTQCKILFITR